MFVVLAIIYIGYENIVTIWEQAAINNTSYTQANSLGTLSKREKSEKSEYSRKAVDDPSLNRKTVNTQLQASGSVRLYWAQQGFES